MTKGEKRKKKAVKSKEAILNKTLREALIRFMKYHSAKRFSKNLRRILLEYLMQNAAGQSIYLYETLMDLHGLFELLDVIESEGDYLNINTPH